MKFVNEGENTLAYFASAPVLIGEQEVNGVDVTPGNSQEEDTWWAEGKQVCCEYHFSLALSICLKLYFPDSLSQCVCVYLSKERLRKGKAQCTSLY